MRKFAKPSTKTSLRFVGGRATCAHVRTRTSKLTWHSLSNLHNNAPLLFAFNWMVNSSSGKRYKLSPICAYGCLERLRESLKLHSSGNDTMVSEQPFGVVTRNVAAPAILKEMNASIRLGETYSNEIGRSLIVTTVPAT